MIYLCDGIWCIAWAMANIWIFYCNYGFLSLFYDECNVSFRIATTTLLFWAEIVICGFTLSMAGGLTPGSMIISAVAIATALRFLLWPACSGSAYTPRTECFPSRLPTLDSRYFQISCDVRVVAGILWFVVLSGLASFVVVNGLLEFPTNWDSLMYHLPLVDHWLQAKSLYAPAGLRWSDPGNNHIVTYWVVGPFSGDFFYCLTNVPGLILFVSAAYEIARTLGLSSFWRHLTTLAVLSNTIVLMQIGDMENDVSVAALCLTCLSYGFRNAKTGRDIDLALGAISLGLLAGIKYYALGYAAVAMVACACAVSRSRGIRAVIRATLIGFAGFMAFGGYWYLRNWYYAGSPLYPLASPVAGDGLSDRYPGVWRTTFIGNGDPEVFDLTLTAIGQMSGPCLLIAFVVLPLTTMWLAVSSVFDRRSLRREDRAVPVALALATTGAGLVWLVTPFAVEDLPGTLNQLRWGYCPVRYGLTVLSLAIVQFMAFGSMSQQRLKMLAVGCTQKLSHSSVQCVIFAALTIMQYCMPAFAAVIVAVQIVRVTAARAGVSNDWLIIALNCWLTAAVVMLVWQTSMDQRRRGLICIVGLTVVAVAGGALSHRWHLRYDEFYDRDVSDGMLAYLRQSIPPGEGVCVLDLRAYPLFGSARQYRVCQPPVTLRGAVRWEDYKREFEFGLLVGRPVDPHSTRFWRKFDRDLRAMPAHFTLVSDAPKSYVVFRVVSPVPNERSRSE